MLKINQITIENVSIKDLKETEEVLKLYNNHINKPEEERMKAVIEESRGKLTEKDYNERINHARSFTVEGEIPTPTDWAQIRTLYRELGNQKISDAREKHESIAKEYTGMATVVDERYGNVSPRQAVINYESAKKNVNTIKKMGVLLSLGLGVAIFLAIVSVMRFVLLDSLTKISVVLVQVLGGVAGIGGLILGGFLGKVIVNSMLKKQKAERDYFEVVVTNNREVITKLQMAIKASEENIKRIEAQYGVEILAKTDFSSLVPFNKREVKKETTETAPEVEKVVETVKNEDRVKDIEETTAEPVVSIKDEPVKERKPKKEKIEAKENINDEQEKPVKKPRTKKASKSEEKPQETSENENNSETIVKSTKKRTKKAE